MHCISLHPEEVYQSSRVVGPSAACVGAGITTIFINHRVKLAFVSSKVRAESGRQISLACSSQE